MRRTSFVMSVPISLYRSADFCEKMIKDSEDGGDRGGERGLLPGVGVFGTGAAARRLVPVLRREGFQVEALWGRSRESAAAAASDLGVPYSTNRVDEVLLRKDVDLVVILCPPAHHSQIAVKALGIGKHVAVQCPGGLTQDEALRMVQAAQYYPRLTATLCCGLRSLPAFEKMRRAVAGGLIGPSVRLCDVRVNLGALVGKRYSWLCDEGMGGGVLNLLGSHAVDLLHFVTGGLRAVRAHGSLRTLVEETDTIRGIRRIGADDFASFQMELEGGAFASVTVHSQLAPGPLRQEVTVSGAEGHLVARGGSLYHCRRGKGEREEPLYVEEEGEEEEGDLSDKEENDGDETLVSGIYLRGLSLLFRHLAETFENANSDSGKDANNRSSPSKDGNSSPLASFDQAQYVQSVLEAVRRSSKQRAWSQVKQREPADLEAASGGGDDLLRLFPPLSPKANLLQKQQLLQQQQRR